MNCKLRSRAAPPQVATRAVPIRRFRQRANLSARAIGPRGAQRAISAERFVLISAQASPWISLCLMEFAARTMHHTLAEKRQSGITAFPNRYHQHNCTQNAHCLRWRVHTSAARRSPMANARQEGTKANGVDEGREGDGKAAHYIIHVT